MHELSIAESILDTVRSEVRQRRLTDVAAVGVRIGALAGLLPDALRFCFDALVQDSDLAGARLVIEHVPVQGRCRTCAFDFEVEELLFACPACSAPDIELVTGEELQIAYIDASLPENGLASALPGTALSGTDHPLPEPVPSL